MASAWAAFWHGFGPRGLESSDQILRRKSEEARLNGWTLWPLQAPPDKALALWCDQIRKLTPAEVRVFCAAARPPEAARRRELACRAYRLAGEATWRPVPERVKVWCAAGRPRAQVLAFVVKRLVYAAPPLARPTVEWFSTRDRVWKRTPAPDKRETLLREGPGARLRPYSVMLVLKSPYLAVASVATPT